MKMFVWIAAGVLLLSEIAVAEEFTIVGQEFAPFNYSLNGKDGPLVTGGMVEVFRKACEKLGAKCKFEILPFQRALRMASEGSVDIILSVAKLREREQVMNYSPVLLKSRYSFFGVRGKVAALHNLSDIQGYTISVHAPTGAAESLENLRKQHGGFKIETENSLTLSMKKLLAGRYGAKSLVYVAEPIGIAWAKQNQEPDIVLAFGGEPVIYHAAYSKKSVSAGAAGRLNGVLNAMVASGEVDRILGRYGIQPNH